MHNHEAREPVRGAVNGRTRLLSIVSTAIFLLFLLAEAIYCYKRPLVSLDSLAYVSITEQTGPEAFASVRDRCVVRLAGQPLSCDEMKDDPVVRRVLAYSPEDFQTLLRFYRVKPLYSGLLNTLHRTAGIESFKALGLISSVSFACIGLILWVWLREHLSTAAASLMTVLIITYSTVLDLGKFLLPDAFSAALVLLAVYLILYRKNRWPGAVLLALLPLARPDNLIFVFFFTAMLLFRSALPRQRKLAYLAVLVVACVAYNTVVSRATHTLPYPVLFTHSFGPWTDPSSFPTAKFTLRRYLYSLSVWGTKTLLIDLPLALFLSALVLVNRSGWRVLRDMIATACAAVGVRILLFPAMELRYYTWLYLLSAAVLTIFAAQTLGKDSSWFRRPRVFLLQHPDA